MTTSTVKLIQSNIKKYRNDKHVTQEHLAEAVGLTTDYISLIEREKRIPSLKTLILIAKALEIEPFVIVHLVPDRSATTSGLLYHLNKNSA